MQVTVNSIEEALHEVEKAQIVFLDTETTGLDPEKDSVRLVQVSTDKTNRVFVIDAFEVNPSELLEKIEKKAVVGHNLKFDLAFLDVYPERVWDTMIAEQMMFTRKRGEGELWKKVSLKDLAKRYAGIELDKSVRDSSWTDRITEEQIRYAAMDVEVLKRILPAQIKEIQEKYTNMGFLTLTK